MNKQISVPASSAASQALSENGFLPKKDPLTTLPDKWKYIDDLGNSVPHLLRSGTIHQKLDSMAPCSIDGLSNPERELLMVRLSFLASAYVFAEGDPDTPTLRIPYGIAQPLVEVATSLGHPPILSYASYCLNNWRRPRTEEPLSLENIAPIQNFLATSDENWFIRIHVIIEQQAAIALRHIPLAQRAVSKNDNQKLLICLRQIFLSLWAMHGTLKKMSEGCSPELYWKEVRPYIFSFTNVVYEGVGQENPRSYRGETGAQSSIVPSLVAAFRIGHKQTKLGDHLTVMQDYMPPVHRSFIRAIWDGPSIPDYITEPLRARERRAIAQVFDACLSSLYAFRSLHFQLAHEYIAKRVLNPEGTGGTPFVEFLAQMRDETERSKLL